MTRNLFPEWPSQTADTQYPFAERVSLRNADGDFIPPGMFRDAAIYPAGGSPHPYVSSILVDFEQTTITIGDSAEPTRATGIVPLVPTSPLIKLLDVYGRPAGVLVSDLTSLGNLQALGIGSHAFTALATEFAAAVCFPTPEAGVRGILLDSGDLLAGDVWMVGSDGVVVRPDEITLPASCDGPERTQRVVRIDVVGDPLFRRKLCGDNPDLFNTPRLIKQIRFEDKLRSFTCLPDEHGNMRIAAGNDLAVDTILRVVNTSAEVTIKVVGTDPQA